MDKVIFSIDKANDLRTLARFLRYVDERRVLGQLSGSFELLIGSYKGQMEYSFMCNETDFMTHMLNSGWMNEQESIVHVFTSGMAQMSYLKNGELIADEVIYSWDKVTKEEAIQMDGFTYNLNNGEYYALG